MVDATAVDSVRVEADADRAGLLRVDDVSVHYGSHRVFQQLSLRLGEGELGCLLGASGSGKSSLLRAIMGFEAIAAGSIRIAGALMSSPAQQVPAHLRGAGMVFQDHALFPHLTVADNIAFGLRKSTAAARRQRVAELLSLIDLTGTEGRYPHQLSGGQQQRIALARALAPKPRLMLLDEPFASLDSDLRRQLAADVRAVLKATGTAALLATHDQQEAFALADQLGVLGQGRLLQWDAPYRVYHRPASRAVAEFVGEGVFIPARMAAQRRMATAAGDFPAPATTDLREGQSADLLIRPDDVLLDDSSPLRATIVARQFRGAQSLYALQLIDGTPLQTLQPSRVDLRTGDDIGIRVEPGELILFPPQAELG